MKQKISVILLITLIISITTFSIAIGTNDPLITESYLNNVFLEKVKTYVNTYIDGKSSVSFEVVQIKKNKTFIGKEGCEFILRQGKADVKSSALGGLSDVTDGYDITEGVPVPANHMLIVPRDDGRGFTANTDVVIMVKGKYEIK